MKRRTYIVHVELPEELDSRLVLESAVLPNGVKLDVRDVMTNRIQLPGCRPMILYAEQPAESPVDASPSLALERRYLDEFGNLVEESSA